MPYSLVYCGQQNGGHANHGVCLTVVGAEESRRRRMGGGRRGEALELGEGEAGASGSRGRERVARSRLGGVVERRESGGRQ